MPNKKTIIFLGDGMADEPIAKLGGKTPLQAASTPAMDSIARSGCSGTLFTLPDGFPTSSEVANMSVFGCDLSAEYSGRGPIEAAGRCIPLGKDDIAFRVNLVTQRDGILTDFSGGHLPQEDAEELIELLNATFGRDNVRFHTGVSYRNLLILSGPEFSPNISTEKPDDNHGEAVDDHLPRATSPGAETTASFLRRLIHKAPSVLDAGHDPVNGIWPWSGGRAVGMRSLRDKYAISGAVISAVDVIMGLGRCLGMDVVNVPGATGYIDTNYEGKAEAAIRELETHDLIYLHIEAIDEVSHAQDLDLKLKAIEDFDSRIVGPVLEAVDDSVTVAVLPDHPVPIASGKHTRTPVPAAVRMAARPPDGVQAFDEQACLAGSLGAMAGPDFMNLLFPAE
jgi:2,3-bisphosphoglycerate-independent phosphoglycerate mutase